MDTTQLIALIIVALIVLAVIIAFRKRIALTLKAWGIDLTLEGENEDAPSMTSPAPAGVEIEDVESTDGGLLIEEGISTSGPGIAARKVKTKDDIIIGKGRSGDSPKAPPPA